MAISNKLFINVAGFMLAALIPFNAIDAQGLQTRLIQGKVMSNGTGIADVSVTDGTNVVKTAADGSYSILTLAETRFVYITVPSGYDVAVKDNTIPQFYKELSGSENFDFNLTKSDIDVKKHVFFVHTDA